MVASSFRGIMVLGNYRSMITFGQSYDADMMHMVSAYLPSGRRDELI